MYIHEVIIDGFKSYATRTVISGFDPQFNAITGLNGTGKSNILDSICFVLGILNLSQVRVGNLQELVYKQGQAGVTKATVSIVFNNNDPRNGPIGYEEHKQITVTRQVIIGGKNKYMINGHTVQQAQIQQFFQSVQLNVNNPHFLIMQGRITKVLNMKPPEILSMIEEAAGTRMYETKKQTALKTLEKKQLKVDELTRCMDGEISPQLEGLREEKQQYQAYMANTTEKDRLQRFCLAYDFVEAEKRIDNADHERIEVENAKNAMQEEQHTKSAGADSCTKRIKEIERMRQNDADGPLQNLKTAENTLSKDLVKITALFTNQKETLQTEVDSEAAMRKQIEATEVSIKDKKKELATCAAGLAAKDKQAFDAEEMLKSLRTKYQNACAGVADSSNADLLSVPEQIATWERKSREADSMLKQADLKATHLKKSVKELQTSLKAQQTAHEKSQKEADKLRATLTEAEQKLRALETECGGQDEEGLRAETLQRANRMNQMRDSVEVLKAELEARLSFEFKDPVKGFDRSKVKGLVAKLVRIPDPKTTTALEIVAGSRLFNVVVDNEQTGKLLLSKGELRKRVTILPLNKIDDRCLDPAKVAAAKEAAGKRGASANLALELVGFDDEVRRAMSHVFGSALICDNADVAKALAFDRSIRTKTVTLTGDVFDPAGTMTGGAKSELGALLSKIEALADGEEKLHAMEAEVKELQKKQKSAVESRAKIADLQTACDMHVQALRIVEDKIACSSYAQTAADIERAQSELVGIDQDCESLKAESKKASDELKKLNETQKDAKKSREQAMKAMEKDVREAQKAATSTRIEANNWRMRRDTLDAEIEELQKENDALKEQVDDVAKLIAKMQKESASLQQQVTDVRTKYDVAKQALDDKQTELNKCSKEIKAQEVERERCQKASQAAELEVKSLEHKLVSMRKDLKDLKVELDKMKKSNTWIMQERARFGVDGGDFDFASSDVAECKRRLKAISSEQDAIRNKVNPKVMGMIEKAETEYLELNRKRDVILKDRSKIEAVIEELDVKKTQSLQSTWIKVNRDFGSIFSMLLPGTQAKLEPLEGCAVSDGLEVKVAFNGTWKDSLTELSGGQRSLLALSLILSMLVFKPAPMYILDEVDAALDLSHTQNIGIMLRTHFQSSQFIVVSLKEGMFNNANIIFKTRFQDGISMVSRIVGGRNTSQRTLPSTTEQEIENDNNVNGKNVSKKKKKKAGGNSKGDGGSAPSSASSSVLAGAM